MATVYSKNPINPINQYIAFLLCRRSLGYTLQFCVYNLLYQVIFPSFPRSSSWSLAWHFLHIHSPYIQRNWTFLLASVKATRYVAAALPSACRTPPKFALSVVYMCLNEGVLSWYLTNMSKKQQGSVSLTEDMRL